MTMDFSAGTGSRPEQDDQARLEELRQREIARRLALREARVGGKTEAVPVPATAGGSSATFAVIPKQAEQLSATPRLPEGFATEEAWELAKSFAESACPDVLKAEGPELSARRLAQAAVETAAADNDPVAGVTVLALAHDHGLQVFNEKLSSRAQALLQDNPLPLPGEPGTLWQIYQDDRRIPVENLPASRQKALLATLPRPLLDDYIDEEWIGAAPDHEGTVRSAYFRARLDPASLTDEEMDLLAWTLERERREAGPETEPGRAWPPDWRLLVRLQANDATAIDEGWSDLLPPTRKLLELLRNVRRTGQAPDELVADLQLWPLLERVSPVVWSKSNKRFNNWIAVRIMMRAVRQMNLARLRGDEDTAARRREAALAVAKNLQHQSQSARWEAQNVRAYLLAGSDTVEAQEFLRQDAEGRPPAQQQLSSAITSTLRRNQRFLESRKTTELDQPLNPYLSLGVPDGAEDWKKAWRTLRRQLDETGRVQVNRVKDMIEAAERVHMEQPSRFTLPLAPHRWGTPSGVSHRLDLPPELLQRLTDPSSDGDREWSRVEAAREIITLAAERLSPVAEHTAALEISESSTS
ncbi:hypothetical protein WJ438_26045 [Streptomyces sp. GD-15H]|uniref:hypothetical protein n=1 Tax=Streptomyces sp. GD-15H TaxID=3129112 RepID=UPI00324BAEB2